MDESVDKPVDKPERAVYDPVSEKEAPGV